MGRRLTLITLILVLIRDYLRNLRPMFDLHLPQIAGMRYFFQ